MTVTPIVAQQRHLAPGTGTPDRPESPFRRADAGRLFRLGRLEADIISVSLAILAGRQPELFDALVGEAEAYAAAETEPAQEPFCVTCGANAGISWLLGSEWHHFRPADSAEDRPHVYDTDHAPVISWRIGRAEIPPPPLPPVL